MVDFQEVQGFFIAAIQLADIFLFRPDTIEPSIKTFAMVVFNSDLVRSLVVIGVTPVLFVQICLQRSSMRWWYTLSITVSVFALSVVVQWRGSTLRLVPHTNLLWNQF